MTGNRGFAVNTVGTVWENITAGGGTAPTEAAMARGSDGDHPPDPVTRLLWSLSRSRPHGPRARRARLVYPAWLVVFWRAVASGRPAPLQSVRLLFVDAPSRIDGTMAPDSVLAIVARRWARRGAARGAASCLTRPDRIADTNCRCAARRSAAQSRGCAALRTVPHARSLVSAGIRVALVPGRAPVRCGPGRKGSATRCIAPRSTDSP